MERVYCKGTKPGGLTFRVRYNTVGDEEDTRYLVIRDCADITEAKNMAISIVEAVGGNPDASSIVATLLWRDNYKPLVELDADVLRARINELEKPPKWAKFIVTLSWMVTAYDVDVDYRYGDWVSSEDVGVDYDFENLGVLSNNRALDFNGRIKIPYTDDWREVLHTKVSESLNIDVPGQNA